MLTDGDISTDGGTGGGTIIGKDKDIDCITPTDEERGGSTIADGTEDTVAGGIIDGEETVLTDGDISTDGGTIIGNRKISTVLHPQMNGSTIAMVLKTLSLME